MVIKALYSRFFLVLVPFLFKTLNVKIDSSALIRSTDSEQSLLLVYFQFKFFAIQYFYSKIFIFYSGFIA